MDAKHISVLKLIQTTDQFKIPIYQRKYSWKRVHCEQLWDDVIQAGRGDTIGGHFIGSIVYVQETDVHNPPVLVIDGQQRLTTLTLLISALSNALADQEPDEGFSREKLKGYYLVNPLEKQNSPMYRKLVLSETDSDTLFAIVDSRELPEEHSYRIKENFEFFEERIKKYADDLAVVCQGLKNLHAVYVALTRGTDKPQLIFESMNWTGRELSQADLVRNYVLMGLEIDLQSRLYEQYWQPMEQLFGQEAYDKQFDGFMRHFLTMKTGVTPKIGDIYTTFKKYARSKEIAAQGIERLVKDILRYSRFYCAMALNRENDPDLKAAFHDLRELRVDVAYPLLLELYADYVDKVLEYGDFLKAVRLVESYVFRRAVCSIPTNSLSKTFSTFGKALKKDRYLESIMAHFLLMPSYRRFPNDEEFKTDIKNRNLHSFRSRGYCLRRLENYQRKERVFIDNYTVEHIMPQNENLSDEWKAELGEDWEHIHEQYLHTLGNLTLTGYNSEYSDRPFAEKRDMKGGFRQSPLKINSGLGKQDKWTKASINDRANRLAEEATSVWKFPRVAEDVLKSYRTEEPSHVSNYSIIDHPFLEHSPTKELFEALRREILGLNPCVAEEVLKLYIAYKAETNFVDVVPQAKGLRLSLNMEFVDINDPSGLCKDVTNIGRWGNGNVEVRFRDLSELPKIVGLVRQSLEMQLQNDDGE